MAATSSGKMFVQKIVFIGSSANLGVVNSFLGKNLPCCCYATFVGKAASSMMRTKKGSNQRERNRQGRGAQGRKPATNPSRSIKMDPATTDWPSVFSGAQSFNPSVIPVFLRMGRPKHTKVTNKPNKTMGNIELMKIPNFFHLSPPAIKQHCEALKSLCRDWPSEVNLLSRPLKVTTRNYIFAGPSLYHPGSRKVKLQICLKDLILDGHARTKLIGLVGPRYNSETDTLTIVTDRCPTRKQNREYALYLLTVLYHEAWKTEPWETEVCLQEQEEEEIEFPKKKRSSPIRLRLVDDELYRFNKYGKGFKVQIKTKV